MTSPAEPAAVWTCPFCPLACDHLRALPRPDGSGHRLVGGACTRAERMLEGLACAGAAPLVDGQAVALEVAVQAAAERLAAGRQPLFAGLGTDVDGARALYPLACATGAITDAAGGDALMQGLRALQDRGQFTTTLAEVRTRADLLVFIGGLPTAQAPLLPTRLGLADRQVPQRHLAVIGPQPGDAPTLAAWAGPGLSHELIAAPGDLFDAVAALELAVAGGAAAGPAAFSRLAERLHQARYAVLVGAPGLLPEHGALIIEAVHRIVGRLNRQGRAAALWIGGGLGAATANQVFTWLSGLPLRSRQGPRGLEHEPLRFRTERLLADGAADALLWVSAFDAEAIPPASALPTVVLGPPAMAAACRRPGWVFIPVATPGLGADGHLFRTDGTVLMPLHAVHRAEEPTVAEVARRLHQALPARAAA